jgi:NADH dehydrogenase/NADH:ubiquinone oxidoreductase subunit G
MHDGNGMMKITIDGKTCETNAGEFLKETAFQNGIKIPSLCHHSALPGQGCCRLCIVEIEEPSGARSVVVSCVYPVRENIVVHTNSGRITRLRRSILAMLKERAPEAEGALVDYCLEYDVSSIDPLPGWKEDEKCILCGLCVKACDELGNSAIQTAKRGIDKLVTTPFDEPASACIGCAACAKVCPVSAIDCESDGDTRTIWNKTFALLRCTGCGEPYATAEELEWLKRRLLDTELNLSYCPRCRGRISIS